MFRARAVLLGVSLPPVVFLAIWGSDVVRLICDPNFYDAGWMLQVLSAGAVASVICASIGPVHLAVGDSYRFMIIQAARTVVLCGTMAVGGMMFGLTGAIVGVAVPEILVYPVVIACVYRYKVWMPWLDLFAFVGAGLLIAVGIVLWN
jgi:O-antigen/teichoic acid export membrane protein